MWNLEEPSLRSGLSIENFRNALVTFENKHSKTALTNSHSVFQAIKDLYGGFKLTTTDKADQGISIDTFKDDIDQIIGQLDALKSEQSTS